MRITQPASACTMASASSTFSGRPSKASGVTAAALLSHLAVLLLVALFAFRNSNAQC